jgi:hypothetical protein
MASLPAATHTIMNVRDSTNATVSAIRMQSDGTLLFRDGNVTVATSTTALSANQWTRIELFYNPASSSQTLRLFVGGNANGSIPDETLNGSASNGASTDVAVGIITSQSNQTYDIDELATGTSGWIGSASTASIPAVSGTIASPVSWSEGSTKGLGFTLYGTNATALPGSWGSGGSYAALPGSGTTFYTRSGFTGGTKDILNMRLRLDTPLDQAPGEYVNAMTITGTVTP